MLCGYRIRCPTYLGPGEQLPSGLAYRGHHVGDLGRSQIMGSLGDPAILKPEGFGQRPKDMLDAYDLIPILWHTPVQVGHVPHLPQTMSVRIFGHFEQLSSFSARRAPCSAPLCTPDAPTNGPYMTWVLWILVPMVPTPRGRSRAAFVKALVQSECGRFCHFGSYGPNLDCHHAEWHGDL